MSQSIETFLERHVEGYLFKDMDNMAMIQLSPGEWAGACGYPMVATVLSGIELLGVLVSKMPFDKDNGSAYFSGYWDNYLGKVDERYSNQPLARLMYNLSRHGLAHMYLTKPGIYVTKNQPQLHLEHDTATMQLCVDAVKFYDDFKTSYTQYVKPIAQGMSSGTVSQRSMQNRLDEVTTEYQGHSVGWFKKLPVHSSAAVSSYISGASTSFQSPTVTTNSTVGPTTFTPPQV